jgi:outer membrane protein
MKRISWLLPLLVWVGGALASDDSVTPVYSLQDCVRLGLDESGVARNARYDQDIAHAKVGQARSLVFPHLSASASYTRLDELQEINLDGQSQTLGSLDNYDVTATVQQLLYSGGRVGAALRAARTSREYAAVARAATEALLVYDVETRFFNVLLAREVVDVRSAAVEQLQGYVDQTVERSENGAASEFEVLTARVRLANEMPQLIAARNDNELALSEFSRLLNLPAAGSFYGQLEQADIDLNYDEMLRLALVNRPLLRSSSLRLDLGHEAIINARSDALPELRAQFSYNGANSYQFVSFDDEWEWHWNAGLVLSWQIWDGNLTRNKVREKQAEYNKLVTDDEELLKSIKLEVKQAYLSLEHAREAIAASGNNVALAERALKIAQTRYKSGLSTYLEFTDANLALRSARLARLQAFHDHAVALSAVRYACGINLKQYENVTEKDQVIE